MTGRRTIRQRGWKRLGSIWDELVIEAPARIGTGLFALDRVTNGLSAGNLIIVGSRAAVGKTGLALTIAGNVAFRQARAVGILSLEASPRAVAERLLAAESRVPLRDIVSPLLSQQQRREMDEVRARLERTPLFIDPIREFDVVRLAEKSRRAWEEGRLDLIIVDYVQLLHDFSRTYESREEEFGGVVRALKHLARQLEIPVIAVSQVSRSKGSPAQPPSQDDLENSMSLVEHADLVLLVHRADSQKLAESPVAAAEIIVAKNRSGGAGSVDVGFVPELATFTNLLGSAPA